MMETHEESTHLISQSTFPWWPHADHMSVQINTSYLLHYQRGEVLRILPCVVAILILLHLLSDRSILEPCSKDPVRRWMTSHNISSVSYILILSSSISYLRRMDTTYHLTQCSPTEMMLYHSRMYCCYCFLCTVHSLNWIL